MKIWNSNLSYHAISERLLSRKRWKNIGAGATGTYVLSSPSGKRVFKLGDDAGLAVFSKLLANTNGHASFPVVYAIINGSYQGRLWNGLLCERLQPLGSSISSSWKKWIELDWMANKGAPFKDPFNVASALDVLRNEAIKSGVGLDVIKTDNVMLRYQTMQIVFSDPLN